MFPIFNNTYYCYSLMMALPVIIIMRLVYSLEHMEVFTTDFMKYLNDVNTPVCTSKKYVLESFDDFARFDINLKDHMEAENAICVSNIDVVSSKEIVKSHALYFSQNELDAIASDEP